MDVSFIIPVCNGASTIERTIESIFRQKTSNLKFEVIVVNNGSTDQTSERAQCHPEVRLYEFSWRNRSRARNYGAAQALGTWLAFIDADVELEEDWLQAHWEQTSRENLAVSVGPVIPSNVDGQDALNRYRYRSLELSTQGSFNILTIRVPEFPMVNSAACFYRKKSFEQLLGFDEELERHEDIDLSRRAFDAGMILAQTPTARAYVAYHDRGWPSYLARSFREGWTKVDYLAKWKGASSVTSGTYNHGLLTLAFRELCMPFILAFVRRDSFYFLRGLNNHLRLWGRLCAWPLKRKRFTPLVFQRREGQVLGL